MKNLVVSQVTISGFGESTKTKELTDYLENKVGLLVWRCRLKTSWTPHGSYPNFEIIDTSNIPKFDCYERVVPHAFVHCDAHKSLMDAAEQSKLILGGQPLKFSLSSENPYTLNPYKLTGVSLEIGTLASSPRVWYRTADDDIYETSAVDLLDDNDPWIRTTDFTQSGAIRRCLGYRVFISPRDHNKWTKVLDYLKTQRVNTEHKDVMDFWY
ncbi:RNA-dependent RNA polymerase-like protein [Arabidopsis thaliana]|uniref:RNA-dependent RNA polymerase-like protein n=1 Tax=Arabidopsis thaliana TaxID=3702 RepID=Q9SHT7_ARATH|nr:RNA-dependent RNA polymerase-like protein [Arabidopsis thaliana]AAD32900.1 hypothetical protein [Arabidopsis thaliana]AEC05921.1 RNA-dependent RNA polymerase-like protein [Arabidopsis thaliana]|eukprot:NP_178605.1 RNA-dependent RNA polymerase-like protein [Arabidopsis thaliana]